MNITENAKAPRVTTEGLSKNQNFINAGGISKGFDVSDYAENHDNSQCQICCPPVQISRGAAKLCADCTSSGERLAEGLFEHLKQNRKVIKLRRCFACNGCFSPSKFSQFYGICKNCLSNRDEPESARRKFAARAINNISKILRGAMAL